jgi:hypothetical protein
MISLEQKKFTKLGTRQMKIILPHEGAKNVAGVGLWAYEI